MRFNACTLKQSSVGGDQKKMHTDKSINNQEIKKTLMTLWQLPKTFFLNFVFIFLEMVYN